MKTPLRQLLILSAFFLGATPLGVVGGSLYQNADNGAQESTPASSTRQEIKTESQARPSLSMFVGTWDLTKISASGGDMTFSTYTKKVAITQPRPGVVSFSFSDTETVREEVAPGIPGVRGPITIPKTINLRYMFLLKQDRASGSYLLTVNVRPGLTINNLPLTYSKDEGFAGEGDVVAGKQKGRATATIKIDKDGGHSWSITSRNGFTLSFSRAKKRR